MQRAQRAADSPLRAILEAGRVRRRAEGDAGDAAEAPVPRGAAVDLPSSTLVTIRTLPEEIGPAGPTPPAALGAVAATATPAPLPMAGVADRAPLAPLPDARALALPLATVVLLQSVEPELAPRLRDLLPRPEVTVEFTIRIDGQVDDVQVLTPLPRQAAAPIAAALAQWRYAPLPAARRHRVELVFKSGG